MRKPQIKAYVMDALQILNKANPERFVTELEVADLTVSIYQVKRESARTAFKWWLHNSQMIEHRSEPASALAARIGHKETRVYRLRNPSIRG